MVHGALSANCNTVYILLGFLSRYKSFTSFFGLLSHHMGDDLSEPPSPDGRRDAGQFQSETFSFYPRGGITVVDLGDIRQSVYSILGRAERGMNIRPTEQVSITISAEDNDGMEFSATVPMQDFQHIDADDVLNVIQNALNSDRTLVGAIELDITVRKEVEMNLRGRNKVTVTQVEQQLTASANNLPFSRVLLSGKKSVVPINPIGDHVNKGQNCLEQFLFMCIASLDIHLPPGVSGKAGVPAAFNTNYRGIQRLVKDRARFNDRLRGVIWLQVAFPGLSGLELVKAVEQTWNVYIVMYNATTCEVVYPPVRPVFLTKQIRCGLVHISTTDGIWTASHIDYLAKPTALLHACSSSATKQGARMCHHCFELYVRKHSCQSEGCKANSLPFCSNCHTCDGTCRTCCTTTCGRIVQEGIDEQRYAYRKRCRLCWDLFYSPKCEAAHVHVCRKMVNQTCANCGDKYHGDGECGEMKCFLCNKTFLREQQLIHDCYVQKEKMKPVSDLLLVYDLECVRNERDIHVPYLATVELLTPLTPKMVELQQQCLPFLKKKFSHRTVNGKTLFLFWGLADIPGMSVLRFFDFLLDPLMRGYTCYAHNGKAYDSIFIKYYMSARGHHSEDITRGRKILSMSYDDLNLRFSDTTCFFPSSLRKLADDFGVQEVKKGYFPHSIMSRNFFIECMRTEYKVTLPDKNAFEPTYSSGKAGDYERKEFELFWSQMENVTTWDMRYEAITYCISDTLLLGECVVAFRTNFIEMTKNMTGTDIFDPMSYITLPSAMMSLFLSTSLKPDSIGIIDRGKILVERDAYARFLYLTAEYGEFLLDTYNSAYFFERNHLVLYADCYMTGCVKCFHSGTFNDRIRLFMGTCRKMFDQEITRARGRFVVKPTVEVVSPHTHPLDTIMTPDIESNLPLDPRDAYKGGKVEVFKIVHKEPLQMCDFVSEYPTTLLGKSKDPIIGGFMTEFIDEPDLEWPFPIGQPVLMYKPALSSYDPCWVGVIKCRVLPPQTLYAPFLSYKVKCKNSYEVLYGNCRSCMDDRSWPCVHTNENDRSFYGTWTCAEIHHAIGLGYRLIEIIDVWLYENSSITLFRDFISPFMIEKILSKKSGIVDETGSGFTNKGLEIVDYLKTLSGGKVFTPADFSNSPARRTVAKLAQNSFTGKWGEIEIHQSARIYEKNEISKAHALFTNPNIVVKSASVLSGNPDHPIVHISFATKDLTSRVTRRKNDIIVAHITAYGRIMLSRLEQALGADLIYEDTDSAFHSKLDTPVYRHGFRTGDLELELPHATNWIALGRKWYTYSKETESVSKLKGFTLKAEAQQSTSFERMVDHLCEVTQGENPTHDPEKAILISQMLFKTVITHQSFPQKQTQQVNKKASFLVNRLKRYVDFALIQSDSVLIDTYPFGFKEIDWFESLGLNNL